MVRTRKGREQVFNIPYIRVRPGAVDYGSQVRLLSISEQEEYQVAIRDYQDYVLSDIPPIHALALNKKVGETISWAGYTYEILQIA